MCESYCEVQRPYDGKDKLNSHRMGIDSNIHSLLSKSASTA